MAGDRSQHLSYAANRLFELWIIYYGDDSDIFKNYQKTSDRAWRAKGLKIELVRKVLLEELFFNERFDFKQYDFIFLPDDDIQFPNYAKDIDDLFKICGQLETDVFQPALSNGERTPPWESTKLIPGAFCHRTNIVEVMMHGFSGKAFTDAFLPAIHAMQFMRSGWGIEPIWLKIGEAIFRRSLRTFVIDAIPAIHTRPLGSGSPEIHKIGMLEARFVPQIQWNRMKTLAVYKDISQVTWP
jgi:hypothetical protein